MRKMILFPSLIIALSLNSNISIACGISGTTTGTASGTVIGIEHSAGCTYILLGADFSSTMSDHDDVSFLNGRYKYLALDTSRVEYDSFLSLALTALAAHMPVYAQFTSRYAVVDRLTIATEANGLP